MFKVKVGEIFLYDIKDIPDQKLTEILIKNQPIKVSFHKLQETIKYFKKYSIEEFQQKFPKKYEGVQQNLNISENGSKLFVKLISGNSIKLSIESSFDLFKFSTFFQFDPILEQIKDYWQINDQITHVNDFISNLLKFDESIKNSEQREYLNHFIDKIEIPRQFSCFISDFFEDFSTEFLLHFLEKCDKKFIPNDELFDYISKTREEKLILLSFLDYQKLSAPKKNEFLLFVFDQYCQLLNSNADYLGKIRTEDKSESLGYLINASKHGNLTASYELLKLYKNDPQQAKTYEFYKRNYRAQKELTKIFQKIREDIQKQPTNDFSDEKNLKNQDSNTKKPKKDQIEPNPKDLQSNTNENNNNDNDNDNSGYDSDSSSPDDDDDDDDDDDEYYKSYQSGTDKVQAVIDPNNDKPPTVIDTNNDKSHKQDYDKHKDGTIPNSSMPYSKNMQDKYPHRYKSDEKPRKGYKKQKPFTQAELKNQEIWKETDKIVKTGKYTDMNGMPYDIKKKVDDCIKNTEIIDKNLKYDDEFSKMIKAKKPGAKEKKEIFSKILVWPESTFNAAKRIKIEFYIREVCALNFASATQPGGGVINGRKAQEETLSRQSSLYHSISPQVEFYKYHKENTSPFYSHYMIYSPNVVVFRDDYYNLINNYRVSVITSAAVNYTQLCKMYPNGSKEDDIKLCMKNRCRKILQIAIKKKNKAIVLGAFGCGVFGNKPEVVSKIFKEIIVDEYYGLFFDKIVFAIKGKPGAVNNNLKAFKDTFNQK